MVILLFVTHV